MPDQDNVQWHQPVMVEEVMRFLAPHPGEVFVDGTAGTGGHSLALAPRLLPSGRLIALDRDRESLARARQRLAEFEPQVSVVHGNFRELPRLLEELGVPRVDGILLDLGMSSAQLDAAERGFSFSRPAPLDMRMDRTQPVTARALVNDLAAEALADLLWTLGEERFSRRIARRIAEERRAHPVETTDHLARLVISALPSSARHGRLHAATKTFQALRMAVNDELGALEDVLGALPGLLAPGGRAAVITFHSLEDRAVKRAFAQGQRDGQWTVLTKKPLDPSPEEILRNPRARSAKLRAVERS